ncbi:TolC family protein [Chitinimonas sp.]|uniref:TolC family protein n=1 Tax=Chitinimonas sp. TaxID=1934313 RepID=UPI002F945B05
MPRTAHPLPYALPLLLAALLLAGCASTAPDGAIAEVRERLGRERGEALQLAANEADETRRQAAVAELLAKPLDADGAVRLAMLNNHSVQADLAELGVVQADFAQSTRLANPRFGFSRKQRGSEVEYERSYGLDILGVLTLPWRSEIESRSLEQARLGVAARITTTALAARKAWVQAVAAKQAASYQADVTDSAATGAELAKRMVAAGNYPQLSQQLAQLQAAEAAMRQERAQQAALEAHEALIRVLSLRRQDAAQLQLPERLPDLPKSQRELREIGPEASEKRLDLEMARREVEGLARSLGLTRTTRFINVLEVSYLNNGSNEAAKQHGYELSLELPLFDWGGARVAGAEARYRQALNRAADIGIQAESSLRASYAAYRSQYALAKRYQDEIVPLRKAISDERQLRYNGMLISVFELMADSREQAAVVMAALDAQRDFWLADADLELATTAGNPPSSNFSVGTASAETTASH